jgi:GNAT superfamily N-acetyltransferase
LGPGIEEKTMAKPNVEAPGKKQPAKDTKKKTDPAAAAPAGGERASTIAEAAPSPAPQRAATVQVERVSTPAQLEAFLELPYRLHKGDPNFVPPLYMERRDFLDPKKNPYFEHADVTLFLAKQGDRVVGRVAAIEDRNYNAFHDEKVGWFGMYEAEDDEAIASTLLDEVKTWVRGRGLATLQGPANFSSNHDMGLLVDGFDSPPVVMMPYNPPYYARHLEAMGLQKVKDLYAFWMQADVDPPEKVVRIAEKVRAKEGIVVRPINFKDFDAELERIKEIYNSAWEQNWGFVPMTEKEFHHTSKDMKTFAVPDLVLIAEVKGEPVAFSMTLPDLNQAFAKVGGKLTTFGLPIGLAKLLWHARKIDQLRLIILGIKEKYRKRGIDAILYLDTLRAARKLGYKGGEISWTLEDNVLVNRAIEMMGGQRYKTYRVYQAEV